MVGEEKRVVNNYLSVQLSGCVTSPPFATRSLVGTWLSLTETAIPHRFLPCRPLSAQEQPAPLTLTGPIALPRRPAARRVRFPRDPARQPCHARPVTTAEAKTLLQRFRTGQVREATVLRAFQAAPLAELGFAQVDVHRGLRQGFPEVIFGAGKTPTQVVEIARQIWQRERRVLVTRVGAEHARALRRRFPRAVHHEAARCVTIQARPLPKRPGTIAVLCAGTSDLPVAEEAAVTADAMGNRVERLYDVGVAGLHRLLGKLESVQRAAVIVAVAGMEGALPSVVAGLVSRPVIAVPTSVGYGASFGGLAALCAMLNSCASGVTVVNIDNGFGAGYAASQINALAGEAT
ncbi:MAG: nickel pincer cofactor biosynthesis protein LarB [Verrucomicrobia bacterium]|nr:nickel pincer cofactor biosynthesis protein LarB [Verrucomicrobiota bacterium]